MTRQNVLWRAVALCFALAIFALAAGRSAPALAQGVTIECPPAETPATGAAATPAAESTPSEAAVATAVPFPEDGGSLTVFAAASLTDAFEEIANELTARYPDLSLTFNFAGSQALVTQLEQGAVAEVFASANLRQMEVAQSKGLIEGEPIIFVQNALVVVVPADNPAGIASPADLARSGIKLVLAQAGVPVGEYARQSLCLMGADPATYGEDFVSKVAANVVSEEDNVRAVLTKVQLGEADAGIVYASDVTPDVASEVQTITIPDAVNVVASYPIASVAGGNRALADAFISYVLSPEGQAILQRYGFEPKP